MRKGDWLSMVLRSPGGGVCVALTSSRTYVRSPAMVELDLLSSVVFSFLFFSFFKPPMILDLLDPNALDLFFQESLSMELGASL